MTPRQVKILVGLFLLLLIAVVFRAFAGFFSPREIFRDPNAAWAVTQLRLPAIILGIFVGAALATAGASFQGILRNPLATPYTLGVAGGANLGAFIVYLVAPDAGWFRLASVPIGAFIGAILTASLVYGLARRGGKLSSYSLILAGVVINFTFASVIMLLLVLAESTKLQFMVHWTMGSLSRGDYSDLYVTLPIITICLILILISHRSFDLLAFGELTAHSMGLDVERFIRWIFIVVSIMVGMCVAVCGPIGFVGLVIPHILRLAFGGRHVFLIPASILAGGAFLCFADALGREALATGLPVGILTAIIGGPILAVLLLRRRGYEVSD